MLDRLLGRASLRERVAALEEEKHHLERRLEAEQERRADAVSDRQDAEERANRLEDRIAELEGRIEAAERDADVRDGSGGGDPGFRRTERLRGDRLAAVLDRLDGVETGPEGALSAMVTAGDGVPEPVRDLFGEHAGLVDRAAPCLVYADDAGLVSAALRPPIRTDAFCEWDDGFRLDRAWFQPEPPGGPQRYAVALVRADTFAIGLYEGRTRTAFDGIRSDVKEQHSKGGFSQGRFERLRDEQIQDHLDRCHEAIDDIVADHEALAAVKGDLPLYVLGERGVLGAFEGRATLTRTSDATGKPEAALDDAWHEFWTTRLWAI